MDDILDTRFEGKKVELSDNRAKAGDDINITAKDPALRKLLIGMGWDLGSFDADIVDLDVSVFLLGRDGLTRMDEDFVFYNNPDVLGGAVRHTGDSRTGAGDGDDESIVVDLQGVPFDVMKLVFVISIYRGEEKQQGLKQIQKGYIRIVNMESGIEILRYDFSQILEDKTQTAVLIGSLNREGPKWHFTPLDEFVEGGLGAVATRYGCIIVQS